VSGTTTIPNDPNPTLRAELIAAFVVLKPQIRGLQDLATTSVSAELKNQISTQTSARVNRQTLIQAVLSALDTVVSKIEALHADGYPALPNATMLGSLFSELQEETSDLEAAIAVFGPERAASMSIGLGAPVDKTPSP